MATEVADQRIDPDALDRLSIAPELIELPTSLRVSQILPVGSFVTGACEARFFDKGLKQHWAIGVGGEPVLRQAPADQRQGARGEIFPLYPGQYQEPGVVDDEM